MREDIIRMAREAGFDTDLPGFRDGSAIALKLAALVAAAAKTEEREACAQVGMRVAVNGIETSAAIRARGDI